MNVCVYVYKRIQEFTLGVLSEVKDASHLGYLKFLIISSPKSEGNG